MAEKYGNRFGAVNGQSADGVREFFELSIALDNGKEIGWWKRAYTMYVLTYEAAFNPTYKATPFSSRSASLEVSPANADPFDWLRRQKQ